MRWIVALALVLLGLVLLTIKIGTRRPKRIVALDAAPAEPLDLEPRPRAAPTPSFSPPTRRERTGVARLKGRVLLPPGDDDSDGLSGLEVVADDGSRSFDGRVSPGGHFTFHLPPGRYTLTASAGDLVGVAIDVAARADAEREIDIHLGPGASVAGTLRAPADADVEVRATISGETGEAGNGGISDGTFEVTGLVPGRRYDLTFSGAGLRTAALRGIVAPATGQEIAVDPLAVVRGAVGFPRGERCPIDRVKLQLPTSTKGDDDGDDDAHGPTVRPGADCRFELTVPDGVSAATILASGPGWYLEEKIDVPTQGDPEPLCLNPPCRDDPTEGLARLRVALQGAKTESVLTAEASVGDESGDEVSRQSCSSEDGWCALEGLPVGQPVTVNGTGSGCRAESRTLTLTAGENFVLLPCHRQRRVEGIVRIADGSPPAALIVRCPGGGIRSFHHTRLFELTCGADDADLEYKLDHGDAWQSVSLPPDDDPAFIELGL